MASVTSSVMPIYHYNSPATIRAKTRALLDWDKDYDSRTHPYYFSPRERRLSSSSACSSSSSSDYSLSQQMSPCSSSSRFFSSPVSPPDNQQHLREMHVFERLRQLVPVLPLDKTAFQILVDSVSQVMELEEQLEELEEQTNGFKSALQTQLSYSEEEDDEMEHSNNSIHCQTLVPADLQSVDVSEFRELVCDQPIDPELLR